MQQIERTGEPGAAGRRRVEAVVHTLAGLGCRGETLAEVAHDARNMVTALGLYCDLLEEPGVLAVPFAHYGNELRLVAAASRRLVEKLVALDAELSADRRGPGLAAPHTADSWTAAGLPDPSLQQALDLSLDHSLDRSLDRSLERSLEQSLEQSLELHRDRLDRGPQRNGAASSAAAAAGLSPSSGLELSPGLSAESTARPAPGSGHESALDSAFSPPLGRGSRWESIFAEPIENLAGELLANRNLLAALAGPGVAVTVDAESGARPVRLTAEDLTRMLVNLVKNASEAMPSGGRIHITLGERQAQTGTDAGSGAPATANGWLVMAVEDNGPGIPEGALEKIFESGFTTHVRNAAPGGWPSAHRGLGLAITRSIVEAAGGHIIAANRAGSSPDSGLGGARFEIELPVRPL